MTGNRVTYMHRIQLTAQDILKSYYTSLSLHLPTVRKNITFYGEDLLALHPATKLDNHPLVGCPRMLIQYIRIYPPYMEAVPSTRNRRR
jgi:hypothetical protein